jgi:hypothetical protein
MGMNADMEHGVTTGISLEDIWLYSIRIVLVLAWTFNLVILGAAVLSAWQGDDSNRVLGVGFLFIWLVLMGMVVVRTSAPAPAPVPMASRS